MNDNMDLHVTITADSAQAVTGVEALNARLSALEQAFIRSSGSAGKVADGVSAVGREAENAGKKAAQATGVFGQLGQFFEDLAKHQRTASMALKTVGLDSAAAAARVDGISQLFMGMGKAVPGLLAAATAVTAVFAGFEEAKNAAGAAAEWQQRMALLGQTVRNQGGDWNTLSSSVQAWADVQEKSTQFSRDDAVQALTTLTSTGMKLSDAMTVTRVAEDAAAATGRSLTEVNFSLSEAMHGRTQALTQLGIGTKQQIKDGMKFADILKIIEKNMGGAAAAAADTYAGKVEQLHNAFQTMQEKIGSAVLPALTTLANAMVNLIDNAETQFGRWHKALDAWAKQHQNLIEFVKGLWEGFTGFFRGAFDLIGGTLSAFVKSLGDVVDFIANVFQGNWRGAWTDIKNFLHDAVLGPMEDAFGTWGTNIITIAERVAQATGNVLGHIAKAWFDAAHGVWGMVGTDMSGALSGYGNVTAGLKWNYRDAFSGLQDLFKPSGSSSNSADIGNLSSGLADEMAGGKLGGIARHLQHIAHAAKNAKEKLDQFNVALYTITDPLKGAKAGSLLAQVVGADTTNPMYGYDPKAEATLERQIAERERLYAQFYQTITANARQWTDTTARWIDEMFAHGKKGVNSFVHAFQNMLKQIEQALLKSALFELFMGAQGGKGGSFLSTFEGYMGFGSKGMGQMQTNGSGGIIGGLIGTSASSQLASSLPTDSLMSLMFGVGAPSTVGGMGGASGAASLGGAALVLAGSGGPGGGTLLGNASGMLGSGASLGGTSLGAILGMHLGGSYVGATLGSIGLGALGGYGIGSLIGNSGLFKGQNDANIGGAIGGGAGAFFGTAIDLALGIGTGGIGLILGPLLGAVGGSLLGGLFGSHTSPATSPDIYNTQDFGQIVANLTGAGTSGYHSTDPTAPASHNWFGANGQKFYDQYSNISGDQSMISFIEKTLAQYATPGTTQMGSNTPSWLAPLWNQLVAAFGVSSSGSGQLNFGHNIGQEWITGAQGASNSPTSYSQLGDLMEQFLQNITTQGNTSWSSYTNPTNNGSGFNVSSPFAGAYIVGTPGSAPVAVTGQSGVPAFPTNDLSGATPNITTSRTMLASGVGNDLSRGAAPSVVVNLTVQGNVTAEQDLRDTIRESIIDNIISHKFGNDMALGGIGF